MNDIFLNQLKINRMHSNGMQEKRWKQFSTERSIPNGMQNTVLYLNLKLLNLEL